MQAAAFPITDYNYQEVQSAFRAVRERWPHADVRAALFNTGFAVWKPFLQITEDEINRILETNIKAAFAFSREVITTFQGQSLDEHGKRGTLLFTGATASLRGNVTTSAFSAAKFALRSLSQSLNKEFSKENIHVCVCSFIVLGTCSLIGPAFLGGACMSLPSPIPRLSDDLSLRSFQVVIDGGRYILTPRFAQELI
jgi:NAD(P)-dependent dehydrogenase (short-subunit alcohol dehydrogenase family)